MSQSPKTPTSANKKSFNFWSRSRRNDNLDGKCASPLPSPRVPRLPIRSLTPSRSQTNENVLPKLHVDVHLNRFSPVSPYYAITPSRTPLSSNSNLHNFRTTEAEIASAFTPKRSPKRLKSRPKAVHIKTQNCQSRLLSNLPVNATAAVNIHYPHALPYKAKPDTPRSPSLSPSMSRSSDSNGSPCVDLDDFPWFISNKIDTGVEEIFALSPLADMTKHFLPK